MISVNFPISTFLVHWCLILSDFSLRQVSTLIDYHPYCSFFLALINTVVLILFQYKHWQDLLEMPGSQADEVELVRRALSVREDHRVREVTKDARDARAPLVATTTALQVQQVHQDAMAKLGLLDLPDQLAPTEGTDLQAQLAKLDHRVQQALLAKLDQLGHLEAFEAEADSSFLQIKCSFSRL